MDMIDQIRVLATRIANTRSLIQTEEATKTAMVMPFIQILGYNVFDPLEVTPELVADVGTKKGEKVDYAILREGRPIMLFECKKAGADLGINHAGQLFRYFHVTAARFGVLTNGLVYRFFSDLEQPNKMDDKPFFEFDVLDFKERDVEELKKFAKSAFDLDKILTTATDMKYTRAIQSLLATWMTAPSEDFVRLVSADLLGTRRFTPVVRDQFTAITRRAFERLVGEKINERLKGAMSTDAASAVEIPKAGAAESAPAASEEEERITTSLEELEGFYIVRSIWFRRDVLLSGTHSATARSCSTTTTASRFAGCASTTRRSCGWACSTSTRKKRSCRSRPSTRSTSLPTGSSRRSAVTSRRPHSRDN